MPSPAVLSSGHTVTFKPHYTHRMECAYKETLMKGMSLKQQGEEVVVESIQPDAIDRASEAVLELLIERISKDGQDVAFSRDWLLDLQEKDFLALRDVVTDLRDENDDKKAAGKKNR